MDDTLSAFELPQALVRPLLEAFRLSNTALDTLFYDVPHLSAALRLRGEVIGDGDSADHLDLSALKNPEGSLLIVDAAGAPAVRAFHDVARFLACDEPFVRGVEVATITGVGSSALGSAALAWNVSAALGRPVLAIVPGYGVADALLQGLGGWFGFGLYDALNVKTRVQTALAAVAPRTAAIGRGLSASVPDAPTLANGAPVFRTGSGSSDVLHAILDDRPLRWLVGHSKGALAIGNALRGLAADRTQDVRVVTLGCPIAEDIEGVRYSQVLGLFDLLGALNAWGHAPNVWTPADHSTNAALPLSLHAEGLVAAAR